jgi:hypothetical protein
MKNKSKIRKDVLLLKQGFQIEHDDTFTHLVIKSYPLTDHWEHNFTNLKLIIPENFPSLPPSLYVELNKCKIYFPDKKRLGYFHSYNISNPFFKEGWVWLCFPGTWDPSFDTIITFLQKIDFCLSTIWADTNELS